VACASSRPGRGTAARRLWPSDAGNATGIMRSGWPLLSCLSPPWPSLCHVCGAQDFASGRTLTLRTDLHKFRSPSSTVLPCASSWSSSAVSSSALLYSPTTQGVTSLDHPEEPIRCHPVSKTMYSRKVELAGYGLLERASWSNGMSSACGLYSTVTDTVLRQLPHSGNNTRPCGPGPANRAR
jgi:hypothetical protein